jgi:hypothetical protein
VSGRSRFSAQVCQELGLTSRQVSIETSPWRSRGWKSEGLAPSIGSPAPIPTTSGKNRRDALIALAQSMGWTVGYLDEGWWSRVAQPKMHAWSEVKQPLRLQELQVSKQDPDPKALCCYGLLDSASQQMRLRFVDGRPERGMTTDLSFVAHRAARRAGTTHARGDLG